MSRMTVMDVTSSVGRVTWVVKQILFCTEGVNRCSVQNAWKFQVIMKENYTLWKKDKEVTAGFKSSLRQNNFKRLAYCKKKVPFHGSYILHN